MCCRRWCPLEGNTGVDPHSRPIPPPQKKPYPVPVHSKNDNPVPSWWKQLPLPSCSHSELPPPSYRFRGQLHQKTNKQKNQATTKVATVFALMERNPQMAAHRSEFFGIIPLQWVFLSCTVPIPWLKGLKCHPLVSTWDWPYHFVVRQVLPLQFGLVQPVDSTCPTGQQLRPPRGTGF